MIILWIVPGSDSTLVLAQSRRDRAIFSRKLGSAPKAHSISSLRIALGSDSTLILAQSRRGPGYIQQKARLSAEGAFHDYPVDRPRFRFNVNPRTIPPGPGYIQQKARLSAEGAFHL